MTPEARKSLLEGLERIIPRKSIRVDVPMRDHTTLHIGGNADVLAEVQSPAQVLQCRHLAASLDVPVLVIGNGSNLLVQDGGIRGLVIVLGEGMSEVYPPVRIDDTTFELTAQAGASMMKLCNAAADAGLTGLEFAAGIPGTVGGAVTMNAGAYGAEMKDVVHTVSVVTPDNELGTLSGADMHFSYRHSRVMEEPLVVTCVTLHLHACDPETVRTAMREFLTRRKERQPLNEFCCGSTFKRPRGGFAAALIDECGLKGMSLGGACVSEKHAGFLINMGDATASEYLALIAQVQRAVLDKTGVQLEPEVCIVGEADAPHEV